MVAAIYTSEHVGWTGEGAGEVADWLGWPFDSTRGSLD